MSGRREIGKTDVLGAPTYRRHLRFACRVLHTGQMTFHVIVPKLTKVHGVGSVGVLFGTRSNKAMDRIVFIMIFKTTCIEKSYSQYYSLLDYSSQLESSFIKF